MCQPSMLWWSATRSSGELQGAWLDGRSLGVSPLTWLPPSCWGLLSRWVGLAPAQRNAEQLQDACWGLAL